MTYKLICNIIIVAMLITSGICYTDVRSYKIKEAVFSQDEITVVYPQVYGLGDDSREENINNLIKNDIVEYVLKLLDDAQIFTDDEGIADVLKVDLSYEITEYKKESLGVLYKGKSLFYTGRPNVYSSYRMAIKEHSMVVDIGNAKIVTKNGEQN